MSNSTFHIPVNLNLLLKELVFRINPKTLLMIMAVVIFLVEMIVMLILSEIPPLSRGWEALLDSSILLLLLTPFYLYIYRPFWEERQKQTQQIRLLSQQLLNTTEEQSKRIAHEIHDQCGQTLTALQFGIQTLKKQIVGEKMEDALTRTDYLEQVAAQLCEELRELTRRLRPVILDEAGLISAITWQVEEFEKNYPDIAVICQLFRKSDLPKRPADTVEDAIYRICQETLTNIARHASATEVRLSLTQKNKFLELRIEDNGCGFNLVQCLEQKNGACGIGLIGMRERALMVGGDFRIHSHPGEGTTILASFPIISEE